LKLNAVAELRALNLLARKIFLWILLPVDHETAIDIFDFVEAGG